MDARAAAAAARNGGARTTPARAARSRARARNVARRRRALGRWRGGGGGGGDASERIPLCDVTRYANGRPPNLIFKTEISSEHSVLELLYKLIQPIPLTFAKLSNL